MKRANFLWITGALLAAFAGAVEFIRPAATPRFTNERTPRVTQVTPGANLCINSRDANAGRCFAARRASRWRGYVLADLG